MQHKRIQKVEELQQHLDSILAEYLIVVTYKPGASARANRRARRITIRPVKGRSTYFTALHEIGHIVGSNPTRRLEQEVAAWRWALNAAAVEPTPGVWKTIHRCLSSYVARAERWANMKLPAADHDFWRLLHESEEGK